MPKAPGIFATRFADRAVLVAPHKVERFRACVEGLEAQFAQVFMDSAARPAALSDDDYWPEPGNWMSRYRPYQVSNGVLQIPVEGALINGFDWHFPGLATGYGYIRRAFDRGMADPEVRALAFRIDSPGGAAAECFDLVDHLHAAKGAKPVRAFAETVCSAAYAIASAADHITITRTSDVGSIGVVMAHLDASARMDKEGFKITFIYAGKHKVDGNAYEPLPDSVRAEWQAEVNELYSVFVATVARNRGLDEQAVRATEARTYLGAKAVSERLADAVGPLDDAVAAYAAELSHPQTGDREMSTKTPDNAAEPQAVADLEKVRAEGRAEGRAAERDRIAAIMKLDEVEGREKAALTIALTTELTADQARALLATFPIQRVQAPTKTPFEAAMEQTPNPELGVLADVQMSEVEQIFASAGYGRPN